MRLTAVLYLDAGSCAPEACNGHGFKGRYVYVIKRLVLEEAEPKIVAEELCTNVDNLYNIKKRAIAVLTEIALKETGKYEKKFQK